MMGHPRIRCAWSALRRLRPKSTRKRSVFVGMARFYLSATTAKNAVP
jgi:hypothetical protein